MDVVGRLAMRGGQTLDLTPREFDLLEYLVRNQGHVVSREMMTRDVWREVARHTPLDNVIDVHVARLRGKSTSGSTRSWSRRCEASGSWCGRSAGDPAF